MMARFDGASAALGFSTLGARARRHLLSKGRSIIRIDAGGTLAVIVVEASLAAVNAALTAEFGDAVGLGAVGLTRQVALLTPTDAKGLEFDAVVVVDPNAIIASSSRGVGALYVALTRATQRLYLVTDGPLPEGLASR